MIKVPMAGAHVSVAEQIQRNQDRYAGGKVRLEKDGGRTVIDSIVFRIRVDGRYLRIEESDRSFSEDFGVRWETATPEHFCIRLDRVWIDDDKNIFASDSPDIHMFVLYPAKA